MKLSYLINTLIKLYAVQLDAARYLAEAFLADLLSIRPAHFVHVRFHPEKLPKTETIFLPSPYQKHPLNELILTGIHEFASVIEFCRSAKFPRHTTGVSLIVADVQLLTKY